MFGSKKSKAFLPYGRQFLASPEYRAVRHVLKSTYLTQGPCVQDFEQALKETTEAPYAVAVANGTVALDLAVRSIKLLGKLQEQALALTTPNTFLASSNALLYNQFRPLFCDISPNTYNLNLDELEWLLHKYNGHNHEHHDNGNCSGGAIQLLLPVHFAGEPVDMVKLWQLAKKYACLEKSLEQSTKEKTKQQTKQAAAILRLPIIEDAAHAMGSRYADGQKVGSCAYSDVCCFSFHPVKTVTTAEGGAITCRDPELYQLLLQLRSHGISRDPTQWQNTRENCSNMDLAKAEEPPLWYYEMHSLGHNARLSDIHAALGCQQLRRLDHFVTKRRELVYHYNQAFQKLVWLKTPRISDYTCPHLYVVQIDFPFLGRSRNAVMYELCAKGIGTQVHYIPVPMQPFYRKLGYDMTALENSQNYYRAALSLPLYPSLKRKEQQRVIDSILALAGSKTE